MENIQHRKLLYLGIVIGSIIIIALIAWLFRSPNTAAPTPISEPFSGVVGEPVDIVLDFFGTWSNARQSTSTDPITEKLYDLPEVSPALSAKLLLAEAVYRENGLDPVFCQKETFSSLRAKPVFQNETEAQFLVSPKQNEAGTLILVTLKTNGTLWNIADISCGGGEVGPVAGEYNFDHTGFLLKESILPPLDSDNWHIVFSQNDVLGFTAPIFFSSTSNCTLEGNAEEICAGERLRETMQVRVRGNVTEAGVFVSKLETVAQ